MPRSAFSDFLDDRSVKALEGQIGESDFWPVGKANQRGGDYTLSGSAGREGREAWGVPEGRSRGSPFCPEYRDADASTDWDFEDCLAFGLLGTWGQPTPSGTWLFWVREWD